MRVMRFGGFTVYVYDEWGAPHNKPHCNVRWADGDTQVDLRSMDVLIGTPLPRRIRRELRQHQDELIAMWNLLNPRNPA